MSHDRARVFKWWSWAGTACVLLAAAGALATDVTTTPFPGVGITQIHRTVTSPRLNNIYILIFDLNDPRIEFFVTPRDPTFRSNASLARTTTFVNQYGLDGAINANFWAGGLGSEGDSRTLIGLALSDGWVVNSPTPAPTPPDPALLIREDGSATVGYIRTFNPTTYPRDRQGISSVGYDGGSGLTGSLLVTNGTNTGSLITPEATSLQPRTVVGVSQNGRTLVIATIDGRTAYSGGVTGAEAADLLLEFGVWNGINCDSGGSTTLVMRYPGQSPQVVNYTTCYPSICERAVANHLGFRVVPASQSLTLVQAFAFGATDYTRPTYNCPSVGYTKLRQDVGSTASLQYNASRGYGYTDLAGLETPPSDNSGVLDGDQLYAEKIGVRGTLGSLTFRADVPNGTYRFVAAGGDAGTYNHISSIRVRNGGVGSWVNMVYHEHVYNPTKRPEFWCVGFGTRVPPPADGSGHDSGTYPDPAFRPILNSPVIQVTSGYLEVQQVAVAMSGSSDPRGGDLCLLELWRLDEPLPPSVAAVTVLSGRTVKVTFSEEMGTGATTPANYTLSGTGKGTLAAHPDSVAVLSGVEYQLTWNSGEMVNGGDITVCAAGVQAADGEPIGSPNCRTHAGGGIGTPPAVADVGPPRGSTVCRLPTVAVTFSESVIGVSAANLTVNGSPAMAVSGNGAGPYTFSGYATPADGVVSVLLAAGSIRDAAGNAFGGDAWSVSIQLKAVADFDKDCDVDLDDFGFFQMCFNGPNQPTFPECATADCDGDQDVDLNDFVIFQRCFNGPNRSPACIGQ